MDASVFEYETSLNTGYKRKGLYLQTKDSIVEISPLPGFSIETFEAAKRQTLALFSGGQNEPLFPSVRFALFCLGMKQSQISGIQKCALLRSIDELDQKLSYERYKLKVKNLSLSEAIQFAASVYIRTNTPLRIDCNQAWSFEKTLSFLSHFSHEIIEYIEEPTISLEQNIKIGQMTPHTIALDESLLTTPFSVLQTLASEVVFILKPTLLGPITPFLALNAKKNVLSSAFETGIGTRWLLNCVHLSHSIDPFVGYDTYEDLLHDPAFPKCSGEITWNVQLENGLKLLQKGPLSLPMEEHILIQH